MIVVALIIVLLLLAIAVVMLARAVPERVDEAVSRLSTEETISELRAAVKELAEAAKNARQSVDRVDRATREEP